MHKGLVNYLSQRSDSFLLPKDLTRTLEDLFQQSSILPQPYKIELADETQAPILGFPLAECAVMKDLESKFDRWLTDEVAWLVTRSTDAREKSAATFSNYLSQLMRVADNAMTSNLLADYHAVFWLAHSFDLAKHFSSIPRRVSAVDVATGRNQGDVLKYRIYAKWATDTREQMNQLASKASSILDGEEQQALLFFRLLQDDVLILTEEFIGPDLRELRSFITGYLRRDFQQFRDAFERLRTNAQELLQRDRTLKAAIPLFLPNHDNGITVALLLDPGFQSFLFEHPGIQNVVTREEREQFQLIGRRVREFAVLNQLRRGIVWTNTTAEGDVVSADRRNVTKYSRTTRPMDFGRPGVVDPMIHRFGLIYDISKFTETLGNIRKGGGKEEIRSYRQMLLFQRKLETIAHRHLLQFEKFLGDGAFYTTRRALRLVRAAVEIQRFYSEMKRKGFAFNQGLRIALNYGYYRLLPMKAAGAGSERITEFYGPGIVELSRLTTGKANKEIEEISEFLVAIGYDAAKVQQFFAPLERGVDLINHTEHAREYYAYLNANGHLVNEGIVGSRDLLSELSAELGNEAQTLYKVRAPWATYIGFAPAVPGLEYIGVRLLGMVSLKGLDNIDVGEIVPFAPGEVDAVPIESGESLMTVLRQDYADRNNQAPFVAAFDIQGKFDTTHDRLVMSEIVICLKPGSSANDEVMIGEWDPLSDNVLRPLRMPHGDFERLFSLKGDINAEVLDAKKSGVRDLYFKLSDSRTFEPSVPLAAYRDEHHALTFVLGEVVEKL